MKYQNIYTGKSNKHKYIEKRELKYRLFLEKICVSNQREFVSEKGGITHNMSLHVIMSHYTVCNSNIPDVFF